MLAKITKMAHTAEQERRQFRQAEAGRKVAVKQQQQQQKKVTKESEPTAIPTSVSILSVVSSGAPSDISAGITGRTMVAGLLQMERKRQKQLRKQQAREEAAAASLKEAKKSTTAASVLSSHFRGQTIFSQEEFVEKRNEILMSTRREIQELAIHC